MKLAHMGVCCCLLAGIADSHATVDRSQEQRLWLADQILSARQSQNVPVEHDALQRLISMDPNDPQMQLELLRYLVRTETSNAAAINRIAESICRSETSLACHEAKILRSSTEGSMFQQLNTARLMAMAGQYSKAVEIFETLFKGAPEETSLLLEYALYQLQIPETYSEGERRIRRLAQSQSPLISREASSRLRELTLEAELSQALKDVYSNQTRGRAVKVLERLIREYPDDPRIERWRNAIAEGRYWLNCDLGDRYLAQGHYSKARKAFESAIRIFPDRPFAYVGLADISAAVNNFDQARKEIERALFHASAESESYRRMLQARIGRLRVSEARTIATRLAPKKNESGEFISKPTQAYVQALEHELELSGNDPWLMYDLAQILYRKGDKDQSISLWQRVDADPDGRYAYAKALFLRSVGRPEDARTVLSAFLIGLGQPNSGRQARIWLAAKVSDVSSDNPGEQVLLVQKIARLAISLDDELFEGQAYDLAENGHYSQAVEMLLKVSSLEPWQIAKAADWAESAGDGRKAYDLWDRIVDLEDWKPEAVFGQSRALLIISSPQAAELTVGKIHDLETHLLAHNKLTIGDVMRMLSTLEDAKQPEEAAALVERHVDRFKDDRGIEAASFWRRVGMSRELSGNYAAALKAYKNGFKSAGILRPGQDFTEAMRTPDFTADPQWLAIMPQYQFSQSEASDRAVPTNGIFITGQTLAESERLMSSLLTPDPLADDGWLSVSLRSRASELYQHNQTVFKSGLHFEWDSGTKGYSDLTALTWMNEVSFPSMSGRATIRTDSVGYDVGALGHSYQNFGTMREWAGADAADPINSDLGQSIAYIWEGEKFQFDIGTTPLGFVYEDISAGASIDWDVGDFGMSAEVYYRPETASLLSYGGQRDPRTGLTWGGVRKLGIAFNFSHDLGAANGFWGRLVAEQLKGHDVADNFDLQAMFGWYRRLSDRPNRLRTIGLSALYWHYDKDLSDYYWGQGGYWSPEHAVSVGGFYEQARRYAHWSWVLRTNLGVSWSKTQAHCRYPLKYKLRPQAISDIDAVDSGDSSFGPWISFYGAVERRLTNRLVVGLAASYQNSDEYAPFYAGLWLRWTFSDWLGDLALPPSPMVPYAAR